MHDSGEPQLISMLPPGVKASVVTVGTFDGVHLGHLDVLNRLRERAQAVGMPSVVVSFHPHPLEIVNPAAAPLLLTVAHEKLELLANAGINYLMVLPFTDELRKFSAEEFVDRVLLSRARMSELLIGYDHGFGRGREGDSDVLVQAGALRGFDVSVVPPVSGVDGRPISSTLVRRAVAGGDLARAAECLGRAYALSGTVQHGAGRGRQLGYPTINVALPSRRKLLPPEGVYAIVAHTPLGTFGGMMNLGARPTFSELEPGIEAHLFDASGNFYGREVRIDFIGRIRDTVRFASVDELQAQLVRDESSARLTLTKWLESNNISSFTRNSNSLAY